MNNRLFVYGTLKRKAIREKALHERHDVPHEVANCSGYLELPMSFDGEQWPTMFPMSGKTTKGEILTVRDDELEKLDAWEDNYKRKLVQTTGGRAWTYIFTR